MRVQIALIVIEVLLTMLFMPIKIRVKGYFCLERQVFIADFKVFFANVFRLRVEKHDGKLRVVVNKKQIELKNDKLTNTKMLKRIAAAIKSGDLRIKSEILAIVGAFDAMQSAVVVGAIEVVLGILGAKKKIYGDYAEERADVQFGAGLQINAVQAVQMFV